MDLPDSSTAVLTKVPPSVEKHIATAIELPSRVDGPAYGFGAYGIKGGRPMRCASRTRVVPRVPDRSGRTRAEPPEILLGSYR